MKLGKIIKLAKLFQKLAENIHYNNVYFALEAINAEIDGDLLTLKHTSPDNSNAEKNFNTISDISLKQKNKIIQLKNNIDFDYPKPGFRKLYDYLADEEVIKILTELDFCANKLLKYNLTLQGRPNSTLKIESFKKLNNIKTDLLEAIELDLQSTPDSSSLFPMSEPTPSSIREEVTKDIVRPSKDITKDVVNRKRV